MLSTTIVLTLLALNLVQQCHNSPVYTMQPAYITANIGTSGRNIRHLPCVSRRTGMNGTCMFAIDCLKANGTHLGTCIDRFYFGSCCHIEHGTDINDNIISDTAIIHDRHPPHRISTSSTSTEKTSITTPTTSVSSNSSTTNLKTSSVPTKKPLITTPQITVTTPRTTSTRNPSPVTQKPQISSQRPLTHIPIPLTRVPIPRPSSSTVGNNVKVATTTNSYKLSTFQSVDDGTTTEPTTLKQKLTTKPIKPPPKPTKLTTTTPKPTSTKVRPRPTVKPVVNTTRPTLIRPSSSARPTTKPPAKPSLKPTAKPALKPISVTPLRTTTTLKPVRTTTGQRVSTTSRPTTSTRPATTPRPTSSSRPTSPRPVSTSRPTTTIRPSTKISTTQRITTPSTLTTELRTTSTTKVTPTTTTESTTTSTSSTTTQQSVKTTALADVQSGSSSTVISNEIFGTSPKPPMVEAISGNTATNEIESGVKPIPEKKPVVSVTTEKVTTHMPGLVTWAMVNNEQTTKDAVNNPVDAPESEWTPITPPDGWILIPSVGSTNPPEPSTTQPASSTTTTSSISTTSFTFSEPTTVEVSTSTSSTTLNTTELPMSVTSEDTDSTSNDTTITMELIPLVNTSSATLPPETTSSTVTTPGEILQGVTHSSVNMSDFTDVCGRRMYPEPRIVGGEKSSFGRWPWQISLRQWKTSTYLHKCGAALLNENWAITAAHCVDNVPPSDLLLRLGEHDLSTDAEPYIHQERRVQIVASHPQFDPRTFEYDLALLRFYEPVQFQPNIIPVCVPQNDETFVGRNAYVTGWGRLYEDGPLPSILQEVTVPVINNTVCEAMYRNAGYIEHIPNIFICAGWKHGGFDSCEGDSGGPMVIQRPDKRFLLAGIISWGIGCAEPNQPGVYTRISEFRDWINQILQF